MITARNYAAQCEMAIRSTPQMFQFLKIADSIKQAVHFALPDGGILLNGGIEGLTDTEFHLPFKRITLEYFNPNGAEALSVDPATGKKEQIKIHKLMLYAVQDEEVIRLMLFLKAGLHPWTPTGRMIELHNNGGKPMRTVAIVGMHPTAMYSHMEESERSRVNDSDYDAITPLYELMRALSCKNVHHELIEPVDMSKNEKRMRKGKAPLYEYRKLVIDTNQKIGSHTAQTGGTHASPRQHLRRGHIRRLDSGNIWVNSCVVGDPRRGVIEKTYAVK